MNVPSMAKAVFNAIRLFFSMLAIECKYWFTISAWCFLAACRLPIITPS